VGLNLESRDINPKGLTTNGLVSQLECKDKRRRKKHRPARGEHLGEIDPWRWIKELVHVVSKKKGRGGSGNLKGGEEIPTCGCRRP